MVATTLGTEAAEGEQQQQQQKQRVYVGGIDPSRGLQVNDVVTRIQNRLPVTSLLDEIHLGSTYSQFTVDDLATYETIHKMFHNVTWKGCKLKIEVARPHLLERLRLERSIDTEQHKTEAPSSATTSNDDGTNHLLRRHWKVKRRYGEPSFAVDTKPFTTDSWETFSRAAKRKRINAAAAAVDKKDKYRSRLNRSIMLRFEEEEVVDDAKGGPNEKLGTAVPSWPSKRDDSSVDLASNSVESVSNNYVWSDDDSSSDDSSSGTEPDENVQPAVGMSSEDESSASKEEHRKPAKLSWKADAQSTMANEFVSAVDFDESEEDEIVEPDDIHCGHEDTTSSEVPEIVDLSEDVDRNMSLLAGLFAGKSATESTERESMPIADAAGTATSTTQNEEVVKPQRKPTVVAPKMMRFDPTDLNATDNYLADSDSEEQASGDDEEEEETKGGPSWFSQEAEKSDPVYEQGKLEEVFKASRESTAEQAAESQASTGMFSFGFEVAETENEPANAATASPPPVLAQNNSDALEGKYQISLDTGADTTNRTPMELSASTPEPNRRPSALKLFECPSDDTLQGLVRSYFFDGEYGRIMNNLDGWRQDPSVKEQWLKQRHTLTLDWRNKRKAALERKKRRGPTGKNNKK